MQTVRERIILENSRAKELKPIKALLYIISLSAICSNKE